MDKDLQKRVVFAGVALAIFIPLLMLGGIVFQISIGLLAMLSVHELLRMKGLETASLEGLLAMLAAFVLTIPIENYLKFLPIDGSFTAYGIVVVILLGAIVLGDRYTYDDAVYPIASSFYVGFGFHSLVVARLSGFDKVLLALFIVWATDSAAYLVGKQYGRRKLMPTVSPNKTIEGSLGGIVAAILVTLVFVLVDSKVASPHNLFVMLILSILFSIAGQFGDLVESAIKRHFGVKDSGKFIPGHGGVLDRFDSLLFVFPIMHLLGLF